MYNTGLKILFAVVAVLYTGFICRAGTDTTRIYFRLDNPALEPQAKQKIDSVLYHDIINASHDILIVGYADHLGTDKYNDLLSENRAKNVKAYLQEMGIPEKQISYCVGKGEIPRDVELPEGYAADRRVDIINITGNKKAAAPLPAARKKEPVPEPIQSKDALKLNEAIPFKPEGIVVGQLFVLDKIFFHTGRHVVMEESIRELENLYRIMDEYPTLAIRIEGHVCCVHPTLDALDLDTGEIALSVNRARYIYSYLVKKGIEKERLSYIGYGKSKSLSPTEYTAEEQDMNKRVEIRIIKK